jgi:hypothetical protein
MLLPSTITLNVGSPAADVVFSATSPLGTGIQFWAPSPNDDLKGRRALRFSHEENKLSLMRSLSQIRIPVLNSEGVYDLIQVNTVLSRPTTVDLALVDMALEMQQELWAVTDVRTAFGQANI